MKKKEKRKKIAEKNGRNKIAEQMPALQCGKLILISQFLEVLSERNIIVMYNLNNCGVLFIYFFWMHENKSVMA